MCAFTYLLSHFSTNVTQTFLTIEAHRLQSPVAQHFGHLRVFLFVFFENQFTFFGFIFVLSTTTIFSTCTPSNTKCDQFSRNSSKTIRKTCSRVQNYLFLYFSAFLNVEKRNHKCKVDINKRTSHGLDENTLKRQFALSLTACAYIEYSSSLCPTDKVDTTNCFRVSMIHVRYTVWVSVDIYILLQIHIGDVRRTIRRRSSVRPSRPFHFTVCMLKRMGFYCTQNRCAKSHVPWYCTRDDCCSCELQMAKKTNAQRLSILSTFIYLSHFF